MRINLEHEYVDYKLTSHFPVLRSWCIDFSESHMNDNLNYCFIFDAVDKNMLTIYWNMHSGEITLE